MKYQILILISVIIFSNGCSIKSGKEGISDSPQVIRLNAQLGISNSGYMTELFDLADIIQLETTEESLLGQVTKMEVVDDRIIILDKLSALKLLVFDSRGKFLFSSGSSGKGPLEISSLDDFCIWKNKIYLLDLFQKKVVIQDLITGAKENELFLDFHAYFLEKHEKGFTFINALTRGVTFTNNKFKEKYTTNYQGYMEYCLPIKALFNTNQGVYLKDTGSDSLFLVGENNLDLAIVFDFAGSGWTKKELREIKNVAEYNNESYKRAKSYGVSNIFMNKQAMYFTFIGFLDGIQYGVHYLYDKLNNKETIYSNQFQDDITLTNKPPVFTAQDERFFYYVKEPRTIPKFLQSNNMNVSIDENPIIVKLKLK
ncbi:MAG: 6-bladed beta-propeller [candidate division Zixibacteria bacterium]|nr:6-bladed beta-propeller [candidate division Zixibacteria bacterium]